MMWNRTRNIVVIMAAVSLSVSVGAQTIDSPERVRDRFRTLDSVSAILTEIRYKSFLYVFDGARRLWKSPQMAGYFCMEKDSLHRDLDGNGMPDFLLSYTECSLPCTFGLFLSLNEGKQNYVIHFAPYGQGGAATQSQGSLPVLESSSVMPARLWDAVEQDLKKQACDDNSRRLILKIIAHRSYTTMQPDSQAMPELRKVHTRATTLYQRGNLKGAVEAMETFFDRHDYRQINSDGTDSTYTTILNDFGFLLLTSKKAFDWTREVLTFVLARDSARASAYLNLGDLLYGHAATRSEAQGTYKQYLDLMTEKGLQHKVPKRVLERARL